MPLKRLLKALLFGLISIHTLASDTDKGGASWQEIAPETYPQERKWVSSDRYPWQAIGRINLAGRGHCSGTLVSDDQVLTSAHCLWNKRTGRWFPPQFITFVAGAEKESFQGFSNATDLTIAPGFSPDTLSQPEAIKHDWALITLEKPLGSSLGYIPLATDKSIAVGQKVIQTGYRADRAYVLTIQNNCQIAELYDRDRIFRTSCKTLGGDSGGPVLIRQKNRWLLAGIHRGRTERNQSLVVASQNFRAEVKAD